MKHWTVCSATILVMSAVPALAHAFLEGAFPAAGDCLHVSPTKVELHFSEDLDGPFSDVRVSDRNGRSMAAGPTLVSGSRLFLTLMKLLPGRYHVTWHVVSVDTHRTEGNCDFTVMP